LKRKQVMSQSVKYAGVKGVYIVRIMGQEKEEENEKINKHIG